MSVHGKAIEPRQIAALRHNLTAPAALTAMFRRVTDSFKILMDMPRNPPFDRVGVICLVWAAAFIALTAVLVVILR